MTLSPSSAAEAAPPAGHERPLPGLSPVIPLLLRAIDETVAERLAPEVQSANAKVMVDVVHALLGWAIHQIEEHNVAYARRLAGPDATLPDGAAGLIASPTTAERRHEEEAAEAAVPREPEGIARLLAAETAFRTTLDPESADDPATAYRGGKSAHERQAGSERRQVTPDRLAACLAARFPDAPPEAVVDFALLPGGFSKETILFRPVGGSHDGQQLVVRKDHAEKGTDFSVTDEFPLLVRLHAAGLPVAEPLWAEADPSLLGAPFLVMRRVPGTLAAEADLGDAATAGAFTRKLAEVLAAIHALPAPDADARDLAGHVRHQIAELRAFWLRRRLEPSPVIDTLLTWLEENVPDMGTCTPSIVHGDYGFHNLIVDGDRVSAILDWEFSHTGDPAEDVAYCRQFLEPSGQWEAFLHEYAQAGGKPWDEARGRFFAIWQNVRNAVYCCGALEAFVRGAPGNIRLASAGLSMAPRFELAALRQILAATGERPPRPGYPA